MRSVRSSCNEKQMLYVVCIYRLSGTAVGEKGGKELAEPERAHPALLGKATEIWFSGFLEAASRMYVIWVSVKLSQNVTVTTVVCRLCSLGPCRHRAHSSPPPSLSALATT